MTTLLRTCFLRYGLTSAFRNWINIRWMVPNALRSNYNLACRTVGHIPKKCKKKLKLHAIVIDMVYFSFVSLLKLILYKSKSQIQMCDWNQICFSFVLQKSYIKFFYMTHTFDSKVSLHSRLLWPTVCRATTLDSSHDPQ